MHTLSLKYRACRSSNTQFLFLHALSAILTFSISKAAAEDNVEHPFIPQKDIKSETCLTCHTEKKEGKFVHSAVRMGCEKCHKATSDNSKTTINFVATSGELCAKCHEPKKNGLLHGPYKNGRCLSCHDPHASGFKAQTRAATNQLCLSCHGVSQPDVKINTQTQTVAFLGGQTLSFDAFHEAPKIGLEPSGLSGHPIAGHPISGADPRDKNAGMSCLSCHAPHSSALPHLLPSGFKNSTELCASCHKR
jgi:predicted CXXCH cytochrome family protein